MRKIKEFFFILAVVFSLPNIAAESGETTVRPNLPATIRRTFVANWFQLTGGAIFDSDGGFSGVTGASWIPTFILHNNWRIRASLGAMMANLGSSNSFFVGDGNLMLVFTEPRPITLEVGGGGQYWDGRRNFHPQFRAGVGYRLPSSFEFLHSIHVYYTHIFTPVVSSQQVMAGFSIRL